MYVKTETVEKETKSVTVTEDEMMKLLAEASYDTAIESGAETIKDQMMFATLFAQFGSKLMVKLFHGENEEEGEENTWQNLN